MWLVSSQRSVGLALCIPSQVALEAQGATLEARVLAVLEFSSERKRMSVLARLPGGRLRLYTKVRGKSQTWLREIDNNRMSDLETSPELPLLLMVG